MVGCASAQGAVVTSTPPRHPGAPSSGDSASNGSPTSGAADSPSVCSRPLNLQVMGGEGKVIVVCAHDLRRAALDESPDLAKALYPALDPAQSRVCACAGRLRAPPAVELTLTAHPADGTVTAEANAEEMDPDLGPPFAACIGTVTAKFDPVHSAACPGGEAASFVYPITIDLGEPGGG